MSSRASRADPVGPGPALRSLVPSSQILFGSDHPYVPLDETAHGVRRVGFSERELRLVGRDNALALLPRLRVA